MTGDATMSDGPTIGRVTAEQVDEAAEILAEAFADEAFFTYLLQAERSRRVRAMRPFFRSVVASLLPFGEIHSAEVEGQLVGVGVRIPPEHFPMSRGWELKVALRQVPGIIRMIAVCPAAVRLLTAGRAIEAGQPRGRSYWYLMYLGVDRRFRRQGIATRLAREVIGRADAARVGCYFETTGEGTVALYRRLGFEVIGEGRPLAGGPVGWRLWRDPEPRRSSRSPVGSSATSPPPKSTRVPSAGLKVSATQPRGLGRVAGSRSVQVSASPLSSTWTVVTLSRLP